MDIFAPRGVPVLAVAPGRARVATNRRGGKVVWLYQPTRGRTFCYAHLDSDTRQVRTGDTLGFVGNTGNASFTDPHLHLGIYQIGGEVWPDFGGAANFRTTPSTENDPDTVLEQHTVFSIKSATRDWYLIRLPDGEKGFLHPSVMDSLQPLMLDGVTTTYAAFLHPGQPDSFVDSLNLNREIAIYGRFGAYLLSRYPDGPYVWLKE